MIVDEFIKKTSAQLLPTGAPSVAPIPSVVPDQPHEQVVGDAGKRTLWVVFFIMLIASGAFAGMAWRVPVSKRLYHVITTMITIFAALSYFAMATGHGVSYNETTIRHQHDHVPDTYEVVRRQVFWARYVDWSVTTPLLLLDLSLLAGLSGAHIFMAVVADVIMILTGLFAAFGSDSNPQKWGWYTISCFAFLIVIWHLVINGRVGAKAKGDKVSKFFVAISGFTLVLWTAYPIVWGIADGARLVSVDAEILCYAVLDVSAKAIFGAWLLFTHAQMAELDLDLGGFWSNGLGREGALRLGDDDGA